MPKQKTLLTAADIDTFFSQLKATFAAAERALKLHELLLASVDLSAAPTPSKAKAAPKSAATKKAPARQARRTRQPALSTEKVLAGLKGAKDGLSLGDLAAKVGEKNKDRVSFALRKLRDEKKAVVKGDRRNARWFAA